MTAEVQMAVDEKKILWKKSALAWACKKSAAEINSRVDELIGIAVDGGSPEEVREKAKYEATELARIMERRKTQHG